MTPADLRRAVKTNWRLAFDKFLKDLSNASLERTDQNSLKEVSPSLSFDALLYSDVIPPSFCSR